MSVEEINCPVCTADVPLAGDERSGEEVFCTCCGAPLRLAGNPESDDCTLEEDW